MISNIKLSLDQADIKAAGELDLAALESAIFSLAQASRNKWIELAGEQLKSSRAEYVRGLQETRSFKQTGKMSYEISLIGQLANMMELGFSSYDMKPGLLAGPSAKVSATGKRYATVPFTHYPGANTPDRSNRVPNYKADLAKIMKAYNMAGVFKSKSGRPLTGKVATAKNTSAIVNKMKPHHTAPIFEGMTKTQKGSSHSTYTTFRRVSQSSLPESWIHPGVAAKLIMPQVVAWAEKRIGLILQGLAEGI